MILAFPTKNSTLNNASNAGIAMKKTKNHAIGLTSGFIMVFFYQIIFLSSKARLTWP